MRDSYFFLRRYKKMLIVGLFLFYIAYAITSSITGHQCVDARTSTVQKLTKENEFDKYEYAVLIASAPDNNVRRDTIRATWMKLATNIVSENGVLFYKWNYTWTEDRKPEQLVKFFFVIGTDNLNSAKKLKLEDESNRSGDLLLLDSFIDSYKSLATKMLISLKWISNNMKGLKYLIKCDDDSFLRIDLIVNNLEAFAPAMDAPEINEYISRKELSNYKGLYWGYFNGKARVFKAGKWEEQNWFLCDRYLPYALGGGYVISRNIVDFIARNADDLSPYNSEDVSMGVWTASLDRINRVHDLRFDTSATSRGCSDNMLIRHKQSAGDMFKLYKTLVYSTGDKLCKVQAISNYYTYNWNVLPTRCCSEKSPEQAPNVANFIV